MIHLRPLRPDEWDTIAAFIHHSTNSWYRKNLNREIFAADPLACRIFPEVYETLDPGCCLVAEEDGMIVGSCFYHPRETHWSLGIMNSAPDSRGVAKAILREIVRLARAAGKPLRLVSSACHLDSFSLYSKAGFRPIRVYQDMLLAVPEDGMLLSTRPAGVDRVRPATAGDLPAIIALEQEIAGLRREKDHRFFLENVQRIWNTLVIENQGLTGFMTSVAHPGSRMIGPGACRDSEAALALVWAHLDRFHRGHTPVWLAPADEADFVHGCYGWGARNCELHLAQVLGECPPHRGLVFPTFMPETA
jgi:hypothetical protein